MEDEPGEEVYYRVEMRLRLYPDIQDFAVTTAVIEADIRDAVDHLFYPGDYEILVSKEEK